MNEYQHVDITVVLTDAAQAVRNRHEKSLPSDVCFIHDLDDEDTNGDLLVATSCEAHSIIAVVGPDGFCRPTIVSPSQMRHYLRATDLEVQLAVSRAGSTNVFVFCGRVAEQIAIAAGGLGWLQIESTTTVWTRAQPSSRFSKTEFAQQGQL